MAKQKQGSTKWLMKPMRPSFSIDPMQTTFFVCVPPYATLEKKRETIELLHNTMVRETGYQGELKNIVLFQYHDDDGVGKDGELFADIKARKAQA